MIFQCPRSSRKGPANSEENYLPEAVFPIFSPNSCPPPRPHPRHGSVTKSGISRATDPCLMSCNWVNIHESVVRSSYVLVLQLHDSSDHHHILQFHAVGGGLEKCHGYIWPRQRAWVLSKTSVDLQNKSVLNFCSGEKRDITAMTMTLILLTGHKSKHSDRTPKVVLRYETGACVVLEL